jgi:hypothetical protein
LIISNITAEQFVEASSIASQKLRHRNYLQCGWCGHVLSTKNWGKHKKDHARKNHTALAVDIGAISKRPFFGMAFD